MDARFQRLLNNMGSGGSGMGSVPADSPQVDTSEQLYISSLALLKMLKHGKGIQGKLCIVMCGVELYIWLGLGGCVCSGCL